MRGWWPFIGAVLLVAAAYGGDRLLVAAAQNAGAFPEWGASLQWSLLDRVMRLVAVLGSGGLAWLTLSAPRPRLVGVAMLAIGLYFALVVALGFIIRPSVALPFRQELYWPAFLVLWVSTAVAVVGGLAAAGRAGQPRWAAGAAPWFRMAGVILFIAVGYLADEVIEGQFQDAAAGTIAPLVITDAIARFGVVVGLLLLAWITLRGARQRVVGGILLAIGLILLAIGPTVGQFLPTGPTAQACSTVFDLLTTPGSVVRWIATTVAVLGVVELASPATRAEETPAAARVEQPSVG